MIVVDAEVMGDFMDQRPGDFLAQFVGRQPQLQVRLAKDVDHVRQFSRVLDAALGQRQPEIKPQQPLAVRVEVLVGLLHDEDLDVVECVLHPVREAGHGLPDHGLELTEVHSARQELRDAEFNAVSLPAAVALPRPPRPGR